MPASLKSPRKETLSVEFPSPPSWMKGPVKPSSGEHQPRAYCFSALAFLVGCFSDSGLRTCGFTAVSSTAVVPVTSALKVAPAGTR